MKNYKIFSSKEKSKKNYLTAEEKERDCKIVCVRMNDSLNLFLS